MTKTTPAAVQYSRGRIQLFPRKRSRYNSHWRAVFLVMSAHIVDLARHKRRLGMIATGR